MDLGAPMSCFAVNQTSNVQIGGWPSATHVFCSSWRPWWQIIWRLPEALCAQVSCCQDVHVPSLMGWNMLKRCAENPGLGLHMSSSTSDGEPRLDGWSSFFFYIKSALLRVSKPIFDNCYHLLVISYRLITSFNLDVVSQRDLSFLIGTASTVIKPGNGKSSMYRWSKWNLHVV